MAKFSIIDPLNKDKPYYTYIGVGDDHTATEWICAKDKHFKQIIDQTGKDTVNLLEWETPLPKRPEDKIDPDRDEFYADLTEIYVKVRIWCGDAVSPWVELGPINQTIQKVEVTQGGKVIANTDTVELKWTKSKSITNKEA